MSDTSSPSIELRGSSSGDASSSALPTTILRASLGSLRRVHASGSDVRTEEIRRAMRLVASEAHHRRLAVEQVIVLTKQLWTEFPRDGAVVPDQFYADGHGSGRRELLDRIIRVLIEEFYRG